MEQIPILWNGKSVGELMLECEPLYTCFTARCRLSEKELWCVWVIGEQGTQRLGILEPEQGICVIRRRISNQSLRCLGTVLNGEIRLAQEQECRWERLEAPERQIRDPWLRGKVKGKQNVLICLENKCLYVAFPYDKGKPFPVTALFCLARIKTIRGQVYAVFAFDEMHRPMLI